MNDGTCWIKLHHHMTPLRLLSTQHGDTRGKVAKKIASNKPCHERGVYQQTFSVGQIDDIPIYERDRGC